MRTNIRRYIFIPFAIVTLFATVTRAQCTMEVTLAADPPFPWNLCPGETILITPTITGGTAPYSYLWGDGSTGPDLIIVPPYYGNVYLMVTDAQGCVAWGEIHIKAWPWTVEIVFAPSPVCVGDSMPVFAFPDFPPGTSFLWSNGETTNPIWIFTPGTYSLTATDPSGSCSGTASAAVSINYWPEVMPQITGPSILCSGQSATLTAVESPDFYYTWNTGDQTQSIQINAPGTYSVTVDNGFGCLGMDTFEVLPGTAPPELTAPAVLCNGESGIVSVDNASSYTSFAWSTGANSSSITINGPGTYSVTVTAPGGCQSTGSVTVAAGNSNMAISGNTTMQTTCANPNGAVDITVSPSGSYTYDWSNGAATQDISGLTAGTYTVTVTDNGGCTTSASFNVTSSLVFPATSSNITAASCGQNNGAIDLTVTPAGTYTLIWSNGATTEDLGSIQGGTYNVTVTSSAGCTATASMSVQDNSFTPGVSGTVTANTSCSNPNGAVDISVTPGGSYSYIWSNGSTTEDISNVLAGTYSVTVSAGGNCTSVSGFTVPDLSMVPVPSATSTPDTCSQHVGSIDLSVTPSGTYTYNWSNGSTGEDLSNVGSGIYSVTITAASNGCTTVFADTLNNEGIAISILPAITHATCGQSNGTIDITTSPSGTYTYLWSNGSMTEDLSALAPGNYSVTVTSAQGCSAADTFLVEDQMLAYTINANVLPNTSCASGNGSIDLTLQPSGMYIFLWSNGSTAEDLSLLASGTYVVTVTLGNTCIQVQSFDVMDDLIPVTLSGISSPNSSCAQPDGAIDLTINYPGAYMVLWSTGETSEDLNSLSGGTYGVTVTGDNGCTAEGDFTVINLNSNFIVDATVLPNQSCTVPDGSIDLMVSPSGAYTFLWSTGAMTSGVQNLSGGTYVVTVTDINSCALIESYSVVDILNVPQLTAQLSAAHCNQADGAIDLNVMPSAGNSFLWSDGQITEDIDLVAAGTYYVTVTGSNGCVAVDTFIIPDLPASFDLSALTSPVYACLNPDGAIDLSVVPSGSYAYSWSNGMITEDLQDITAGTYTVTVSDIFTCLVVETYIVEDSIRWPQLSAITIPAHCGMNDGAIDLVPTPPGSYTYMWSDGSLTEDLNAIIPGNYAVTVTSPEGCMASDTFIVANINTNFTVNAVTGPDTACLGSTGFIDLSPIPAGSYTFLWSNGSASEDLADLEPGLYAVTVTDVTGCASLLNYSIEEMTHMPDIAGTVTPAFCGMNTGTIVLNVTPAVGNQFLWSTGASAPDLIQLAPGTYQVTVTGSTGCMSVDSFMVPAIGAAFMISGQTIPNSNCILPNGSIDILLTPSGNYQYTWSNGSTQEDQALLGAGDYIVTVSDLNGCILMDTFMVNEQLTFPELSAVIQPATCGGNNGGIDLIIQPPAVYTILWSNTQSAEDLIQMPPGLYSVTVTHPNGCAADTSFEIINSNVSFSIMANVENTTSCLDPNGMIDLMVNPSGLYSYSWSNGASTEDIQALASGLYTVTVSDEHQCSTSGTYGIEDMSMPPDVTARITPPQCGEANGRIDLNVTPDLGNQFAWSHGETVEDVAGLFQGQYSVTVTAANGCTWTGSFTLPASSGVEVNIQLNLQSTGSDTLNLVVETNIPLQAIDTVVWSPGDLFFCAQDFCLTQTIARPVTPTEISVLVIDTNGCQGEGRLLIEEEDDPKIYIPNVFSPNQDGINDYFTIYGNKDVELIMELRIFDRWGNMVFRKDEFLPNVENYGWDGVFKGDPMNPAVFAFWARVLFTNGHIGFYRGDVTLVR